MFFVIWGHFAATPGVEKYIYSFHMPAYFILSGMLFVFNREQRPVHFIWKRVKTLVIPYFLLNLYMIPIWWWNVCLGNNTSHPFWYILPGILIGNRRSGFPMASNTTWFILCLFLTEILFFVLQKIFKRDRWLILGVIGVTAAAYLAGVLKLDGSGPWHWQTTFTAEIFFLGGYLFCKYIGKIQKFLNQNRVRQILLPICLFAAGMAAGMVNGRVSMIGDYYKNIPLFYLSAFATSIALMLTFMMLSEHPKFLRWTRPCKTVGLNTLPYIAFQVGIMKLMMTYIPFFGVNHELNRFLMAVILYFAFIPAAKALNHLIPRKWYLHFRRKGIVSVSSRLQTAHKRVS